MSDSHSYPFSLIGVGIYGVTEAARLTGVPAARIRRWICGYRYATTVGQHDGKPIVDRALPTIDSEVALSFLDLIEVKIANAFRNRKVSWKTIRAAAKNANELFKIDHPFANRRFKTDGRGIFTELRKSAGERSLVDITARQLVFRSIVDPHLSDVEFDGEDRVTRWWPLGTGGGVLLDPRRSFGQPIVRAGVPTSAISRAFKAEKSIDAVALWFEIDKRAVRDALEFEEKLAA